MIIYLILNGLIKIIINKIIIKKIIIKIIINKINKTI